VNENLRYTIVLVVIIGRGVFAAKQLEAGEFVCQYYGELVSSKIGSERESTRPSQTRRVSDVVNRGREDVVATPQMRVSMCVVF